MVSEDDKAPEFTGTLANEDLESFDLGERVGVDEGPLVLAFFPGAFTPTCRSELVSLQGELDRFEREGAGVVGVSVDSPFALQEFAEQNGVEFDLVSDMAREGVEAYDVRLDAPEIGLRGAANRAVFVLGDDGAVQYIWEADDPTNEPDYDELVEAVRAAADT